MNLGILVTIGTLALGIPSQQRDYVLFHENVPPLELSLTGDESLDETIEVVSEGLSLYCRENGIEKTVLIIGPGQVTEAVTKPYTASVGNVEYDGTYVDGSFVNEVLKKFGIIEMTHCHTTDYGKGKLPSGSDIFNAYYMAGLSVAQGVDVPRFSHTNIDGTKIDYTLNEKTIEELKKIVPKKFDTEQDYSWFFQDLYDFSFEKMRRFDKVRDEYCNQNGCDNLFMQQAISVLNRKFFYFRFSQQ